MKVNFYGTNLYYYNYYIYYNIYNNKIPRFVKSENVDVRSGKVEKWKT